LCIIQVLCASLSVKREETDGRTRRSPSWTLSTLTFLFQLHSSQNVFMTCVNTKNKIQHEATF